MKILCHPNKLSFLKQHLCSSQRCSDTVRAADCQAADDDTSCRLAYQLGMTNISLFRMLARCQYCSGCCLSLVSGELALSGI
jgi:hypothetical protein